MDRMVVQSSVGPDGILSIPMGIAQANQPVIVTIEPKAPTSGVDSDYHAWLNHIAGAWQGKFERGEIGEDWQTQ